MYTDGQKNNVRQINNPFSARKAELLIKLQHLTTKDIITTKKLGITEHDTTVCFKVEACKGESITVTAVPMALATSARS